MSNAETMPKIGIITIQNRFNYGNRLQNYATQHILENYGFKVESLVPKMRPNLESRLRYLAKRCLRKEDESRELFMSRERLAAFDEFNQLIHFRDIYDTKGDEVSRFDLIVTGSDQIWAMRRFAHGEHWAYLQFARREQRVALAPSLGLGSASTIRKRRLARYLKGYESVSVREESGADLIYSATGREAVVLCDPTLVLNAKCWSKIADNKFTPSEPYVFTYLLGERNLEAEDVLARVTHQGETPIVSLSDCERQGELPAGPSHFISLISNASHVVTDSFHAAVFSVIMRTPLTIVHREGGNTVYSKMFGRLETLANKLSIKEKIYGSQEYDLSRAGDYEGISELIENERRKFIDYLESRLDAQLPDWSRD